MSNVASGPLCRVLVVVVCALFAASASAQAPEPPGEGPPIDAPPAEEAPPDAPTEEETPTDEGDVENEEDEPDDEEPFEDDEFDDEEGEQQREEGQVGDVDETVIEYGETPEEDEIDGAAPIPMPRLTGPRAELQDEDKLEPGADKDTGVQGRVVSRSPKKVLPDAPVTAKGERDGKVRTTLTDERGRYQLFLPPGQYTLRSFYDLYHGARWDDVQVQRGKFKRINFVLDPITAEDAGVEEMEVPYLADTSTEAAQLNIRKEAVAVQDAISAEEISRTGDGTAKGAAARVVGVTIDEDGRIVVRGLGGAYNRILLNGIPVPSVDPDVPAVKLDIFPTDIVSNLSVVKSPVPTLPGNFAGGLLLIETSSFPQELEFKVGVSLGVNSLSSFQDMPTYQGGRFDWFGFDDGTRRLPGEVGRDRLAVDRSGTGEGRYQTFEEVAEVGRTFEDVWNPRNRTALPNLGLGLSVGNTVNLKKKGRRAGYLLSLVYDYQDKIRDGFNRRFRYDANGNSIFQIEDFDFVGGRQEVLWGTFASGFVEFDPNNRVSAVSFFSRTSQDTTLLQLGEEEDNDILQTKNSYDFVARSLFFNQLMGDHSNIGNSRARFRWNAVVSTGRRDQPDRREIQQQVIRQTIPQATRFFADLTQIGFAGKASVRFPMWQEAYGTIGVDGSFEQRDFLARRFLMTPFRGGSILFGDPEDVYGPEALGVVSNITEITTSFDSYDASNTLYGGFAQLETRISRWLRFLGLMRFEVFQQQVTSKDPFEGTPGFVPPPPDALPDNTDRTDIDHMPSASFSFEINPEMFIKIGYGMTVIRPSIRELAPFAYTDFLRGWVITGNADLRRTRVQNVEARYEWYFGDTNLLAATGFFKWFRSPIEFVVFSQTNEAAGYQNAEDAWLAGGEVELRLGFGTLTEKLDKFFFLGNVALMASETRIDPATGASGRTERQLYNQSPYVTNLSLRFDDPDSGVMVGLVYNAFGPRIVEVGGSAGQFELPDVFEQPQHILDLVASWQPTEHLKLGFKWRNIAFAKRRFKQGNELVLLENLGTSVGIGAEYIY